MNPVDAGLAAESKILQLATATRVGFDVPDTCVTNDLDLVRGFADEHQGNVVVKALDAPLIEDGTTSRFVFTSRLDLALLAGRENPEVVPMIFQEEISRKRDVRILVVDGEAFAFAIDADPSEVDWRRFGREAVVTPIAVPPEVINHCTSFLTILGLRYGAFDFAVSADRYAFLECNQNGEWGWLQRATGAPVAETIASALARMAQVQAGRP
jgi:glutathione synthase/RimK-type ligase-like ATP-grasp enzyme